MLKKIIINGLRKFNPTKNMLHFRQAAIDSNRGNKKDLINKRKELQNCLKRSINDSVLRNNAAKITLSLIQL